MSSIPVRRSAGLFATYVFLIAAVLVTLFPLYWIVVTSFKIETEFMSDPPVWIPGEFRLQHYQSLFDEYDAAPYFKNTAIIAVGNMALILVIAVPAAYAVARYRVGGRLFSFWILSHRMVPPVTLLIPIFIVLVSLKLIDTFPGMILAYSTFNLSLAVWLLISFFEDFPQDLQDQAMVDGCSEMGAIWRVVLPLIAPGLVVVALFIFIFSWNQLMFPLALSRMETRPIMMLFVSMLRSPTHLQFGEASATVVLSMLPAIVLSLFFQRYIVKGLAAGAFK
jgi:multiple sugar transport system permease protein